MQSQECSIDPFPLLNRQDALNAVAFLHYKIECSALVKKRRKKHKYVFIHKYKCMSMTHFVQLPAQECGRKKNVTRSIPMYQHTESAESGANMNLLNLGLTSASLHDADS